MAVPLDSTQHRCDQNIVGSHFGLCASGVQGFRRSNFKHIYAADMVLRSLVCIDMDRSSRGLALDL
ncbi:hypothetical protein DOTSEDRAFT_75734, partial [Dothistroma septosporum NZE10]